MNSTHGQTVVDLNLVSSKILDGKGVKAMTGSINARPLHLILVQFLEVVLLFGEFCQNKKK